MEFAALGICEIVTMNFARTFDSAKFCSIRKCIRWLGNRKSKAISLLHASHSKCRFKGIFITIYTIFYIRCDGLNPLKLQLERRISFCKCTNSLVHFGFCCMPGRFSSTHSLSLSLSRLYSFRKSTQLFSSSRVMSFLITQWNTWTHSARGEKRVYRAAEYIVKIIVN